MLADVVERLACPHCAAAFDLDEQSLVCAGGHEFGVARQGYVSLIAGAGAATSGDSSEMVAAREAFLGCGHYRPIAETVAAEVARWPAECVLDVGAGTGYYLRTALDTVDGAVGIALDASKPAARRAARCHPRVGSVVADAWRGLPVRDRSVSVALVVFAPRGSVELRRVLTADGTLIVVTPTPRHLAELVSEFGLLQVDERKPERLRDAMAGVFERIAHRSVEYPMTLSRTDVAAVIGMGPSAWHTTPAERARRVAALDDHTAVTASVQVSTYRPLR